MQQIDLDTEAFESALALFCQQKIRLRRFQIAATCQTPSQPDPECSGEMIVTRSCEADRGVAWVRWAVARRGASGENLQSFQGIGDRITRKTVIAVSAFALDGDNSCLGQPREMAARRVRGYTSNMG